MLMLFVPRDFCAGAAHVLGAAEFSAIDTAMGRLLSDYFIGLANRLPAVEAENLPELVGATQAMIRACVLPSSGNIEEAQAPIARVLLESARRIVHSKLFDPSFNAKALHRDLAISRSVLLSDVRAVRWRDALLAAPASPRCTRGIGGPERQTPYH